jgi:hypothetical protein
MLDGTVPFELHKQIVKEYSTIAFSVGILVGVIGAFIAWVVL